jgi:hypothetical protein
VSRKTGRLSVSDMASITEWADTMPAGQIAERLNRTMEPIVKYLEKIGKGTNKIANYETQAEYDLSSRPYWKQIKKQFTEDELDLFLYHWKTIIGQFQKDVLPTEEMQIVDMVKLDVLMNRALNIQKDNMDRIVVFEEMIKEEARKPSDERDREYMYDIEKQIAVLKAAHETLSREYKDLQDKKMKMFTGMKATREQRIQKLESNKETFAGLIQKILRDPEWVSTVNREMEMMRVAAIKEKVRLSDYHTYSDGEVDQVFLSAETVILEDKKENSRNLKTETDEV